ncbi:hypothetical protein [Candidatus Methylacidithermus pantelleriae]|nr:hypothetical protein [Candidatus Methylacidithermus pantelleriae]
MIYPRVYLEGAGLEGVAGYGHSRVQRGGLAAGFSSQLRPMLKEFRFCWKNVAGNPGGFEDACGVSCETARRLGIQRSFLMEEGKSPSNVEALEGERASVCHLS